MPGVSIMAKVPSYHSDSLEDKPVYHDHDDCWEGRKIERKHLQPGTGGKRRCEVCTSLG
jgi:hypothetical protein